MRCMREDLPREAKKTEGKEERVTYADKNAQRKKRDYKNKRRRKVKLLLRRKK